MADSEDIVLDQGSSTIMVLRWENPDRLIYRPITALATSSPATLVVPNHGLVDGWSAAVTGWDNAVGLTAEFDQPRVGDFKRVRVLDSDTIEFNSVDGSAWRTSPPATARVRYYEPVSLIGCSANMQVRSSVASSAPLLSLSSLSGGIVFDTALHTITVNFPEAINWSTGVYDLEVTNGSGKVTRILQGRITVSKEITRT